MYGGPVHGYIKSFNKGEARWHLCLFLGKVEGKIPMYSTDGVQVVLHQKNRSRLVQVQKPQFIFVGVSSQLWSQNHAKRRAEALPAAQTQTDIPREHPMVKFRDEDAEAVMAKALEGGSRKNQRRFQPR